MPNVAKAKESKEIAINPIEKAKTILFKKPVIDAVMKAELGLQKVQKVEDEIQKATLTGLIKLAKDTRKIVAELRLSKTRELEDMKKVFMNAEGEFAAGLDKWIASATKLITDYNNEILKKQQEEEARIREEEAKKLKRLSSPKSIAAVELNTQAQLQTVATTSGIAKVWAGEVVDESLVPREYLVIDQAKINQAIKNGVREIPGVKIEQKARTVIR